MGRQGISTRNVGALHEEFGGSAPCLSPVLCGADVPGEEQWMHSSEPGRAPAQMNAGKSMDLRAFTDHIWAHLQVCSASRIFCRFGGLLFPASRRIFSSLPFSGIKTVPEKEGKSIVSLCHRALPGVPSVRERGSTRTAPWGSKQSPNTVC